MNKTERDDRPTTKSNEIPFEDALQRLCSIISLFISMFVNTYHIKFIEFILSPRYEDDKASQLPIQTGGEDYMPSRTNGFTLGSVVRNLYSSTAYALKT